MTIQAIIQRNPTPYNPENYDVHRRETVTMLKSLSAIKDLEKEVIDIVVELLGVDESEVSASKSFVEDLNADFLDHIELIMIFEEKFEIEIPDKDAAKLKTVGDVVSYIEEKSSNNF